MANTISELNNKVKVVDQEKESLLTAIRLIYDDTKANLLDRDADKTAYVSIPNKRKQPSTCSGVPTTAVATPLGINQYSPLSIKYPTAIVIMMKIFPMQHKLQNQLHDQTEIKRNVNTLISTLKLVHRHRKTNNDHEMKAAPNLRDKSQKINNMTTSQSWEIPC